VSDFRFITLERSGDVAVLRLNRPDKLNALFVAMLEEINAALDRVPDIGVRALIITGEGSAFSSGGALIGDDGGPDFPEDLGDVLGAHYAPLIERLFALPLPIVTAVNGAAAGAGCSIALSGDIVIAARSAYFLQAFANIGLVPDAGSTWLLPRTIGRARAMEMMLLAERVSADTALSWGMINRVVEDDELMPEAMALATRLARGPTIGLGLLRKLARQSLDASLTQAMTCERNAQSAAGHTEDFRIGVAAFLARAPASFHGR
jgi:2-(1,2-epoxy-1,2-dihydrophenyl)acetyl-CoA isomerase